MPQDYLLEVLLEDMPARFIVSTLDNLKANFETVLGKARLGYNKIETFGTLRRLGVTVTGLADSQADVTEEFLGPPAKIAFDENGKPTKAGVRFAESKGGKPEDLIKKETPRGEVAALTVHRKGRKAAEILSEVIPQVLLKLDFPVTMSWGKGEYSCLRPVHGVVSLLNKEIVAFKFCGVDAGRATRGNRIHTDNAVVEIPSVDAYGKTLRSLRVEPDMAVRRSRIEKLLEEKAKKAGGAIITDEKLLALVVQNVEYPEVLLGSFDKKFLDLPREVLISSMREHQKYFTVEDKDGKLLPNFLAIVDVVGEKAEKIVLKNHERVLLSRLEDAEFFWGVDKKTKMEAQHEELKRVIFIEKLGSYYEKIERLQKLAPELAKLAGKSELASNVQKSAALCKSDLVTNMVGEFPELQGVMGGLYAKEEGEPEAVWKAVYEHYRPQSLNDTGPESDTGAILAIADRLDSLIGCFSIGLKPTGSKDPYALRRQAQTALKIVLDKGWSLDMWRAVDAVMSVYDLSGNKELKESLRDFFIDRFRHMASKAGFDTGVTEAVASVFGDDYEPCDANARLKALSEMKESEDLMALATAFKRVRNILKDQPRGELKVSRFEDRAEKALYEACVELQKALIGFVREKNYEGALKSIAFIRPTVDRFFDEVMVMSEDEAVRKNRVALLYNLSDVFLCVADISHMAISTKGKA